MPSTTRSMLGALCMIAAGCASTPSGQSAASAASAAGTSDATLAQVYFWRARPGMVAAYDRYIREVAEPIDREAQRAGAFVGVTTYAASDSTLPWTHMRVFLLRDSAQLRGLSAALGAAGTRLEPDSARRQQRGAYSATLRDAAGSAVTRIVR